MAGTLITNSIAPDVGTNLYLNATQGAANVVIGNTTTALATFTNAGTLIVSNVVSNLVGNVVGNVIGSIANTNITGNIISSQITSVSNTQITGILAAANGGTGNAGGAWTNYTPTISAATGTITTSSATGQYQTIGKTCIVSMTITITTAGTGANQLFATLPFTSAARIQSGTTGAEVSNTGNGVKGYIPVSSTQLQLTYYNNSTPIGSGNIVIVTTTYEIA